MIMRSQKCAFWSLRNLRKKSDFRKFFNSPKTVLRRYYIKENCSDNDLQL